MKKQNHCFASFNKTRLLPIRLQLFAEGEEEQEVDYKALYEKMKSEKDKASKEASDFKKKLRDKETAEETKAREEEAEKIKVQEDLAKLIKENQIYKLKSNLAKDSVLNGDEIDKIVEARLGEDDSNFAKVLNDIIKKKLADKESAVLKELKRTGRTPNGSTNENNSNEAEDMAKRIAQNKANRNKNRFDSYFKEK